MRQTHDETADLLPAGGALAETLVSEQAVEHRHIQNNEPEHRQNQTIFEEERLQADQKLRELMNISRTGTSQAFDLRRSAAPATQHIRALRLSFFLFRGEEVPAGYHISPITRPKIASQKTTPGQPFYMQAASVCN